MTAGAGVLRSAAGLAQTATALGELAGREGAVPCTEAWEATNLLTVATVLTAAAAAREETRGSHWREDHPDRDDDRWLAHVVATLPDGAVSLAYRTHVPSAREGMADR